MKMPSSGSSRKRKRAGGEPTIHPRNRYADKPPDFALLASLYPSFAPFVFYHPPHNGLPRIDWTDFNATRELTRILLLHDHGLDWRIPDGQLCPTVPNRSNYIHWIEDLLASEIIPKFASGEDKVRGFDIGTGANCIYPLLGASLLGWSFVASDFTPVALEWAEKNAKSNSQISNLIEIRKVENVGATKDDSVAGGVRIEENIQSNPSMLDTAETREVVESSSLETQHNLDSAQLLGVEDKGELACVESGELETQPLCDEHEYVDVRYNGPPILLGVVKDGEKFDFCMCNPPFFESMEESGLNPKTACGGTPEEMVCKGGERAFISRIIEDSVILGQSFRWYTSMLGKKSNLKFLIAKLRAVGVTIVKTTEFVQGRTSRWGLAWSFLTPTTNLVLRHATEKSNLSFMLEGLQRQVSAFTVLQSVESFFLKFNASCKVNSSMFTVDVAISNHHCNILLNNEVKSLDDEVLSRQHTDKHSDSSCLPDSVDRLSFRVSVFQQIPGTLLVKGSLQQRNGPLSGTFSSVFRTLDEFLRCNFCKDRAVRDNFVPKLTI